MMMVGWILRAFKMKEANPVMALFTAPVVSRLDNCCLLTSLYTAGETAEPGNVARLLGEAVNL